MVTDPFGWLGSQIFPQMWGPHTMLALNGNLICFNVWFKQPNDQRSCFRFSKRLFKRGVSHFQTNRFEWLCEFTLWQNGRGINTGVNKLISLTDQRTWRAIQATKAQVFGHWTGDFSAAEMECWFKNNHSAALRKSGSSQHDLDTTWTDLCRCQDRCL